jgi:hypothetical protein
LITPDSDGSKKYIPPANAAGWRRHCDIAEQPSIGKYGRSSLYPGYQSSPAFKVKHGLPYINQELLER